MRYCSKILTLAIMSPPVGAAAAQIPPDRVADVRCLIASVTLASNAAPAVASIAQMSSLFWLGRLGAFDENDVERIAVEQALKMTAADIKLELQRCGAEMQARGDSLQRIGKKMQDSTARADTH